MRGSLLDESPKFIYLKKGFYEVKFTTDKTIFNRNF
jgi:hypothetical protein